MRAQSARDARQRRTAPEEHAGPDIDRELLCQERVTTVALAVDALPAHQREAIVTAFYGERTYRDAAAALGYAEGTVKSRIRAGLHRLRADLVPVAG
jgi:RNA polymerase sigma-70 factor (ECF subfamily)